MVRQLPMIKSNGSLLEIPKGLLRPLNIIKTLQEPQNIEIGRNLSGWNGTSASISLSGSSLKTKLLYCLALAAGVYGVNLRGFTTRPQANQLSSRNKRVNTS